MNNKTKYSQLYSSLLNDIEIGTYKIGDKLPTETELAQKYGISRQTVRQALGWLESERIITRRQGSGSFVSNRTTAVKTKRIAVITTYISEYIFPSILRSIEETASLHSYSLLLNATNNSIAAERKILTGLLNNQVDGIIVEGTKAALPNPNVSYYNTISDSGTPIVFINSIYKEISRPNVISVTTDDYGGGQKLAEYLISKGHKHIGGIFKSDDAQGISRFSGAVDGIVRNNLDFKDDDFIWFTTESKKDVMNHLSAQPLYDDCTAVICYNDEIASVFMRSLDGSSPIHTIASFDRNLPNVTIPSGMTFYSLPHPKGGLGRVAAEKLFNMINGKSESSVILPWEDTDGAD